jgi:hypothetical protein
MEIFWKFHTGRKWMKSISNYGMCYHVEPSCQNNEIIQKFRSHHSDGDQKQNTFKGNAFRQSNFGTTCINSSDIMRILLL